MTVWTAPNIASLKGDNTFPLQKIFQSLTEEFGRSGTSLAASLASLAASLALKANIASPTFTGTVGGITKTMVGLGNVDNTADTAKPVSTAQQTALNLKANIASPTFTGTVTTTDLVANGNVTSMGRGEFRTLAAAGRGVGIGGGTGDTPAILQFLNNAFGAQWSSLVATNNLLTVTTPLTVNSTVTTPALTVNGVATSQSFTQGTDYLSPYQGFRNKIINGSFEFWQRGTARTYMNAGQYLADRWTIRYYQNASHKRTAVTPVTGMQTRYALKVGSLTVGGGARMWTNTELESGDSIPLRGKTMTLSFWVRFSSATCSSSTAIPFGNWGGGVDWCIYTTDAAMGSTPADGFGGVNLINGSLPTTWTKYTTTVTLPSNINNVGVYFGFSGLGNTASADTVWYEITQVQLEEGSVATPFEQRPIQQELTLCERYYESSFRNGQTIGHASGNFTVYPSDSLGCGGNSYFNHFYRTRKRTHPSLRVFDPLGAHTTSQNWWRYVNACNGGTAVGPNAGVALYADDVCFSGYLQTGATGIAPIFDWTVEAEL
jgi:hypothetical protein